MYDDWLEVRVGDKVLLKTTCQAEARRAARQRYGCSVWVIHLDDWGNRHETPLEGVSV